MSDDGSRDGSRDGTRKRKRDDDPESAARKRRNNAKAAAKLREGKKQIEKTVREILAMFMTMGEHLDEFGYTSEAERAEFDKVVTWLGQLPPTAPENVRSFVSKMDHLRNATIGYQDAKEKIKAFCQTETERSSRRGRKPGSQSVRRCDPDSADDAVNFALTGSVNSAYVDTDPL